MNNLLEIGQIVNTYGIKGFIKVVPLVDYKEQFKDFHKIYIDLNKENDEFLIEEVKFSKDLVLLKLEGIETIEQAENFRNKYIKIKREDIKLEKGAHFIVDLLGLEVYTDDGILLGNIKEVLQPGCNDVYIIKNNENKEILIPVIPDVVKKIDIENHKVIVHLIDGLLVWKIIVILRCYILF